MDIIRRTLESSYRAMRPLLFKFNPDAETAHHTAVKFSQALESYGLANLLLGSDTIRKPTTVQFANAAGSNKEGTIPPAVLAAFGFDVNVVGTVTARQWDGNPKPRVFRDVENESVYNKMGLPGRGSMLVENVMLNYSNKPIPTRVSIMSTPERPSFEEQLSDVYFSASRFRYLASSAEINVSCPNTKHSTLSPLQQMKDSGKLVKMVYRVFHDKPKFVKLSPDMSPDDLRTMVDICMENGANGFITTNTTMNYDREKLHHIAPTALGGLSGDGLYGAATRAQEFVAEHIRNKGYDAEIHACGGINSVARATERASIGKVTTIQLYTALIYNPGLMRELRAAFAVKP